MYAVIQTGGKQHRVTEGQRLDIERVRPGGGAEGTEGDGGDGGDEITFTPRLLVDGGRVIVGGDLEGARVAARVVGESKGPKIRGFTYRPKARTRRRWGHRQGYSTIEIVSISTGSS